MHFAIWALFSIMLWFDLPDFTKSFKTFNVKQIEEDDKEARIMRIASGFTRLRQIVNLSPVIDQEMKRSLASNSMVVQEKIVALLKQNLHWSESAMIMGWVHRISEESEKLKAINEQIEVEDAINKPSRYLEASIEIANELRDLLVKVAHDADELLAR